MGYEARREEWCEMLQIRSKYECNGRQGASASISDAENEFELERCDVWSYEFQGLQRGGMYFPE